MKGLSGDAEVGGTVGNCLTMRGKRGNSCMSFVHHIRVYTRVCVKGHLLHTRVGI